MIYHKIRIMKNESETKVVLKPVWNIIFVIFGRSKAKDKIIVNFVTLRLQTFGTRLCYQTFMLIIDTFLAKRSWNKFFCPNFFYFV
ncbi:hypothetical protein DIS13_05935 [Weissella paramesenteroides]|nr:hypothetical protein [Weissella paramesenteroides]TPF02106.1 hypothetical protein DIS13_05935 [Weissella paramesenteroides]